MSAGSRRRELGAALAAAFLAGAWTETAMVRRGGDVLSPRPRWLRPVVRRVLQAYPRPPADRPRELASYIELTLRRHAGRPQVLRWRDFAPQIGRMPWPTPPMESPGELSDLLELDAGGLMWLADARGLERSTPHRRLRNYTYRWRPRPDGPPRPLDPPKARRN